MPSYEDVINSINKDTNNPIEDKALNLKFKENLNDKVEKTKTPKNQIKNTTQTKIELKSEPKNLESKNISTFEDLIKLSTEKREIELKYDLERNVNLIKFSEGKIDISFNQNLDKNFVRNLSAKLAEWTGNRWVITLSKEMGKKTFFETQNIEKKELLNKEKEGEFYKNIINIFSDAELLEVKKKD